MFHRHELLKKKSVAEVLHMCIYIYIHYIILFYIILYYTILYYIILYYIILYYIILYYTISHYIILYYSILHYTILYYIILYYIMLYYIMFFLYLLFFFVILSFSCFFFIFFFFFFFLKKIIYYTLRCRPPSAEPLRLSGSCATQSWYRPLEKQQHLKTHKQITKPENIQQLKQTSTSTNHNTSIQTITINKSWYRPPGRTREARRKAEGPGTGAL